MILEKAYQGTLPFLCVNACEEDGERILPILKMLQDNGARLWYREDKEEESRLKESEAVLSIISDRALGSHEWRKEFNACMLERKPIVAVILEDAAVSLLMNRQLEMCTRISGQEYQTDAALCVRILQAPEVKKCLEEEKTVKIPKAFAKKYYLKRKATSEEIYISKDGFTVGRRADCDFAIAGNMTISRCHMIFELEDGICRVRDCGSTNHVYVNDEKLEADGTLIVKSGDLIEIGNEKFIVEVIE